MGHVIDWGLATQLGSFVSGDPAHSARPDLAVATRESERLVSTYTGLVAAGELPAPELVARPAWIDANLRSLRSLLDPLAARVGEGMGPLGPAAGAAAGFLLAAEAGVLLGYAARRVLGQYELVLLDPDGPARLLFVGPNLDEATRTMGVNEDEFVRWVALHEVTHALQFGGVPWLREHLAGLLRSLMDSMEVAFDPSRILRMPTRADLRTIADAVMRGDLLSVVAGPQQRRTIEQLQSVMAVLEGHAEHVMDAVGEELLPSLSRLREGMTSRRREQSPVARLLSRLFGLDLKMQQYIQGKRFCDGVVEAGGPDALSRLWTGPDALPTPEELAAPDAWLARTAAAPAA